jgi:hypothetical protein
MLIKIIKQTVHLKNVNAWDKQKFHVLWFIIHGLTYETYFTLNKKKKSWQCFDASNKQLLDQTQMLYFLKKIIT